MFSRIRYAAKVLSRSPKVDPREDPDICFEHQNDSEVSTISRFIGASLEIFVLSLIIGAVSSPLVRHLAPSKPVAELTTIAAYLATALALTSHNLVIKIQRDIASRLHLGTKIAPYFGHKIVRAFNLIRG